MGAADFLSKPVDCNELMAPTRSLLRLQQLSDELENAEGLFLPSLTASKGAILTLASPASGFPEMSARLGESLELPEEYRKALRRAGIVHDISKVVVPDAILLKPAAPWENGMK